MWEGFRSKNWPRTALLMVALVNPFLAPGKPAAPARNTEINGPTDLAYANGGFLFIVENPGRRLSRLDLRRGVISRVDTGTMETHANAVAADQKWGLYMADFQSGLQYLNLATGARQVLIERTGDVAARIDAMVVDNTGNVYLSQAKNHQVLVWKASSKQLSIVAGTGKAGFSGDGEKAEGAELRFPGGLALNPEGDLLVADSGNCRIRKIDRSSGVITTIAGSGVGANLDDCGFDGDGGQALKARLGPGRIAVDKSGAIFVVVGRNRIRRIDPSTGVITTLAGTGKQESTGDGGPASKASLAEPSGVAVDLQGNIYISEYVGNRVRRIDAARGTISTVAGNGLPARADAIL